MSRLTLKLWASMMVLILIALLFLWTVQTVYLQPNYNKQAFEEMRIRFSDLIKNTGTITELKEVTSDENNNSGLYYVEIFDQVAISSKLMYKMSLSTECGLKIAAHINNAFLGTTFEGIMAISNSESGIFIVKPIYTNDGNCYVAVIGERISSVTSIQQLLRNQLNTLSVLLLVSSFILSLFLAGIFTKPILAINKTVNRISDGDLDASAKVNQDDELGELSHSVDNLAQSLKKVDFLRKEVIANVSHELKSPLSLIRGYAELVREISWKNEKDRNDNLNLIIEESQRMSIMVNDILDYSLIQSGYLTLNTEILSLDTILTDAAVEANKQGEKFSLDIEINNQTPNVNVCVDNIKIHQVFRNLLNNAINHSLDGEKIKINSSYVNGNIRIEICNKGDPIPEDQKCLIWERYHRSQHQGGRKQGTGLGLSIVKTICDAHNMTYGADYIDNNNVFWFQIPMKRIIFSQSV